MAINKVVYGSETLIDLTSDTATAADVAQGKTFHLANGTQATGTSTGGGGGGGSAEWTTAANVYSANPDEAQVSVYVYTNGSTACFDGHVSGSITEDGGYAYVDLPAAAQFDIIYDVFDEQGVYGVVVPIVDGGSGLVPTLGTVNICSDHIELVKVYHTALEDDDSYFGFFHALIPIRSAS